MAKKNAETVESLQKQIDEINNLLMDEGKQYDDLTQSGLPPSSEEYQKIYKAISDNVERLQEKEKKLEEKIEVLKLQG